MARGAGSALEQTALSLEGCSEQFRPTNSGVLVTQSEQLHLHNRLLCGGAGVCSTNLAWLLKSLAQVRPSWKGRQPPCLPCVVVLPAPWLDGPGENPE